MPFFLLYPAISPPGVSLSKCVFVHLHALLQRFLSNFSAQFLTLISIHSKAVIIHSTPSWRVDQLRMDSRSPSNKFYFAPSFVGDHLYFSFLPSIFMVSFELLTSSMKGNLLPVTVQLRSNSQYCGVFPDFEPSASHQLES